MQWQASGIVLQMLQRHDVGLAEGTQHLGGVVRIVQCLLAAKVADAFAKCGFDRVLQGCAEEALQVRITLKPQRLGHADESGRCDFGYRRHRSHRVQRDVVGVVHRVAGRVPHARREAFAFTANQVPQRI